MKVRHRLGSVAALLVLVGSSALAVAAGPRHSVDEQDLAELRRMAPQAAELFEQAEALLAGGDWVAAERKLGEARKSGGSSFVLARRHCQVLTELGERSRALVACKDALAGATALDERAYVGALMSGPELATPEELARALHEATNARRLRGQVFSDAALCEIALKVGDQALFRRCLERLRALAPGHYETARFSRVSWGMPSWIYASFWLGLLALGSFCALGAIRRALSRGGTSRLARGSSALLALALLASGPSAQAAEKPLQLSEFVIDFEHPERTRVPTVAERNANPLQFGYFLQDIATEAFRAERLGQPSKAAQYWALSAEAVPDQAVAFSNSCRVRQALGEREKALEYCSRALNLQGVTHADYVRFAQLMVAKPTPLLQSEIDDAKAVVEHLRAQPGAEGPAAVVECQLGVKLNERALLERCAPILARLTPNDPHALTYQWALSMARRDYSEARGVLRTMETSSMERAALLRLRSETDSRAALWRRPFEDARYGLPLLGALLLVGFLLVRSRTRLVRLSMKAPPSAA